MSVSGRHQFMAYWRLALLQAARRDVLMAALFSSLFLAVVTTALGSLWKAAAGDQVLDGYDATMLVWYVAAAELAVTSVNTQLVPTLSDRINEGDAATLMCRPVRPAWWFVAEELGPSLVRLCVMVPMGFLVALLLIGSPPSWPACATLVITLPLALTLLLVINTALAGATFWLGDSRALNFLHMKVIFLVGGMLIPPELCPAPLNSIFPLLPWASIAYAPARALVAPDGMQFVQLVGLQLFWLATASLLLQWVYARGQQQMAVGGG